MSVPLDIHSSAMLCSADW